MKVRAAVLEGPGRPFTVEELDLEPPGPGEVQVRVRAAGVCASDWHLVTGATKHPFPVVAGHEGSGVVEAVGPGVARVRQGDAVILDWAPGCGTCFDCRRGRPALCEAYVGPLWAGTMLDGRPRLSRRGAPVFHFSGLACFAERCVVPEVCCVPADPRLPPAVAAVIGCAVATGWGAVFHTAKLEAGAAVAVFGAGGVGLSVVLSARLAGAARIVAVDPVPAKLEMARAFGATDAVAADLDAAARVRALCGGRGADVAFEASGRPEVQEQALLAIRPGGLLVLVGLSPMGSATNLPGAILVRQEKTVAGSYYGGVDPPRDFPRIAAHHLEGRLDLGRLVTRTYALEAINEAYADLAAGRLARGVIAFP